MKAPAWTAARFGIAWRLSLAFIGVGGLAVVACLVGWLSYGHVAENLDTINRVHLPAASLSAKLTEQGGAVIATAPVLALARTPTEYEAAKRGIDRRLVAMRTVLAQIGRGSASLPANAARLDSDVEAIAQNLADLDKVVRERLDLEKKNREAITQLRWLQADIMEEAEPLAEDSRFVIRSALAELGRDTSNRAAELKRLEVELKRTEAVTALNAQANLAVGLMNRIATLTTLEELAQTMYFLAETADAIEPQLVALANVSDAVTLRQVLRRLIELSAMDRGIPGIRRAEILAADEARALLAKNRELVDDLNGTIASYVYDANVGAAAAAAQSDAATAIGRNLLLGVALLSILAVIGIGVFYVQRNLVSRIVSLAGAARALGAGDLATPIDVSGQDELSDMAYALKRFRDTKEELVQAAKLAALGGLAAGVGHELNQPLAAIRSHAHNGRILIARDRAAEADTALARIEALTVRMADTVAHLKRFARKPEGRRAPVPLRKTVESALDLFGTRFADEDIDVVLDIAPDCLVMAEEVSLEQVFVNMLSNAIDAMKNASRRQLSIRATENGEEIAVAVRDTGHGVAAEQAATIFDPFVTTKPIGAGLGLGLSISYNIAKDFGGLLALTETGSEGSTFVLSLKRYHG